MNSIVVNNRPIGDGYPTYVIAEIGINHKGNLSLAREMIDAAWQAGADAVKIQTFITRDFLHPDHPGYRYDIEAEISHNEEQGLWDFAKTEGINLFSTPEEFKSLAFIASQNPHLIKIAAMDFNYQELIQAAAAIRKPIILSSGMSTLEEVLQAVRWVEEAGNPNYAVLHCVSCYPTPAQACNLSVIRTLKNVLSCPIGFSDHTEGIHIPLAAVALGANIIEKHFTIDKSMPGPDQRCSMDTKDLKDMLRQIRDIESAIGHGRKEPALEEHDPRIFKRRGVYAAENLQANSVLERKDVLFMAPSNQGSHVTYWPQMEGRRIRHRIRKMQIITLEDFY
jgi:N,N'-diacetyllegionaminate synthase